MVCGWDNLYWNLVCAHEVLGTALMAMRLPSVTVLSDDGSNTKATSHMHCNIAHLLFDKCVFALHGHHDNFQCIEIRGPHTINIINLIDSCHQSCELHTT